MLTIMLNACLRDNNHLFPNRNQYLAHKMNRQKKCKREEATRKRLNEEVGGCNNTCDRRTDRQVETEEAVSWS